MLDKDDDVEVKKEFMHPFKIIQIDQELVRKMLYQFKARFDKYNAIKIGIKTAYGWKQTIGAAFFV